MELPYAVVNVQPDPLDAISWLERIEEAIRRPISAALQNHLTQIEWEIEREIAMRGDAPTDDECIALLAVRNYIGQCDAIIPKPQPYIAPPPKSKAPRKPPMEPKGWEETMDSDEVAFCMAAIDREICAIGADFPDNFRAARMWKSSQRRRFSKQRNRGCCGSHDFVAKRWSWSKMRYDLYLLGFNYGH
ncbi:MULTISPECIES: hypothetical protein [unclassified Burkholderia]|uniref:hypothetical protein n=1 Tax=unclassified Burkholderia TaxID=2613784 RepID=UPI000F571F66|nr:MULTISPECIES: hypothetical protein [unclassified Burkholderia]RQR87750.1 hypothetical protein DIE10_06600 [Burkholderia sp. Bp9011]